MKTKNQLVEEAKIANPKILQTINGVEIELDEAAYNESINAWAEMRLEQLKAEAEQIAKAQAKAAAEAKLEALGLTVEELKALGLG